MKGLTGDESKVERSSSITPCKTARVNQRKGGDKGRSDSNLQNGL